ncbi:hypothetical protein Csa_017442 [Cucumis sativus]|nr:hypothetical protein Csa_017442 [Cucumis sativus]
MQKFTEYWLVTKICCRFVGCASRIHQIQSSRLEFVRSGIRQIFRLGVVFTAKVYRYFTGVRGAVVSSRQGVASRGLPAGERLHGRRLRQGVVKRLHNSESRQEIDRGVCWRSRLGCVFTIEVAVC